MNKNEYYTTTEEDWEEANYVASLEEEGIMLEHFDGDGYA